MTAIRDWLIEAIHWGADPFDGFPLEQHETDDFAGFGSEHPWLTETIDALRPRVVVEVGTFLGAGARVMAGRLRDLGLDAAVVAVDTYLAEEVLWSIPEHRARLRFKHGRPEFYGTWMANAIAARLTDYLVPLPMASVSAARYLQQRGVQAQVVYVDACHEPGDVRRDLDSYWDRVLAPGGAMLIDDYQEGVPMVAGVVQDTDAFCRERGLSPERLSDTVRLFKPRER